MLPVWPDPVPVKTEQNLGWPAAACGQVIRGSCHCKVIYFSYRGENIDLEFTVLECRMDQMSVLCIGCSETLGMLDQTESLLASDTLPRDAERSQFYLEFEIQLWIVYPKIDFHTYVSKRRWCLEAVGCYLPCIHSTLPAAANFPDTPRTRVLRTELWVHEKRLP